MDEASEQIIQAIEEFVDANRRAREVLEGVENQLGSAIDRLRSGESVVHVVKSTSVSRNREQVQEALEQVNGARHRFRLRVVTACIDGGMTPREVAEWWGISRQRVDQFIQEFRRSESD